MRLTRYQYRALYAAFLILAFFIPAYEQISAFGFLRTAIGSVRSDTELTFLDLLVILIPLLLVPATAIVILVRSVKKQSVNSILLCLPFFSLAFFFLILSFDMSRQVNSGNALYLLRQMSIGFYLAVAASVLLLLSYNRRETLNLSSRRR